MTNAFAYPCQKVLKKYSEEAEIAAIIKDIENAKQGVVTFSKEVKKYMLSFIHARYDDNAEVNGLIDVLRQWTKYQNFNQLEIFQLQDECYFWYDFLSGYAIWKIIQKKFGFETSEKSFELLIRLVKNDPEIFNEYKEL